MSVERQLLGVVLAGGGSVRFGRPKADAQLGRLTLLERARRALAPLCPVVVAGRAPDLEDLRPGQGPLGGLETALEWARRGGFDGVAVLACDLPVVPAATLLGLSRAWRAAGGSRNAICVPSDPLQPLCGIWGVEVREAVGTALDEERRSARAFVEGWPGLVRVPASELADEVGLLPDQLLLNVNVPEELVPARELVLPPVVSVMGWKDSGKTSVATALVAALVRRGIDVAALKHGHGFDLDREGTDSWRFRHEGGARRVLLAGPEGMALMGGWRGGEPGLAGLVRRHLRDAEVVVAEGWKAGPWPAVEVRAPGDARPPLVDPSGPDGGRLLARVDEGPADPGPPARFLRSDPALGESLADLVEARVLASGR